MLLEEIINKGNYKLIKDITAEESAKLISKNKKFKSYVEDSYIENDLEYIGCILDCVRESLSGWSIGFYNHNYMDIKTGLEYDFLNGVESIQNDYGLLYEVDIDKAKDAISALHTADYNDKGYEMLETVKDSMVDEIKNLLLNEFNAMTNHIDDEELSDLLFNSSDYDYEGYYYDCITYEVIDANIKIIS